MINNTLTGGGGWLLGNLGRGIEYISPFSGRDDNTINSLLNAGYTLDEIDQIYPNEDSWVTSVAKATLSAHNAIDDSLQDWRNDLLGDNPTLAARVAEGSGSSIGFLLAGLAASYLGATTGLAGLFGAGVSGGLESISEVGKFMGDAYRNGLYDKGALGTANKDFLANLALNTGLNYTVGAFNPYIRGIVNPVNRWLASTAGETVNELLQEPSQQTIEQAATHSLNTNSDFLPNLYDSTMGNGTFEGKGWLDTAQQLAPEVALSTLLTQVLTGAGGIATRQGRNRFMADWNRRHETKSSENTTQNTSTNAPNVTPMADNGNVNPSQHLDFNMPTDTSTNAPIADNSNINPEQQLNTQPEARITPQPETEIQTAPTVKTGSNTTKIRTMKGTEVEARYRVIDADDLITSTNERGGVNPNYLAELQPRDRGTSASNSQIMHIANNLDPELLGESRLASDGAPVIGSDLMVESGNGRVMAIRNAYKYGQADKYRQWLKDNASYFGIDPAYIDTVNNPVLVRERITDVDRSKFTSEANESSIAAMSTTEHALDDAKKITPEILTFYDADKKLEENKNFLNWFVEAMPKNEQGDLKQKDGRISRSGIERARNALVALAYNDAGFLRRLSESYDDEVKNITDGLTSAASKIAILESGKYPKYLSIRKDILQALNTLADLRANNQSVQDYLPQILMFEEDEISPEAKMLLQFFDENKNSYKNIAQGLTDYVNLAMNEAQEGQGLLFEDSTHTKSELLQQVLNTRVHSREFINWFGDWQRSPKNASKVVDKNGFPLTVYHGTESKSGQEPFSIFDTAGRGIAKDTGAWFNSNSKAAKTFGNYVYDVYLDIKHPYIFTAKDRVKDTKKMDQIVRDVKAGKYGKGYDGVIFRNVEDVMHYFDASPDELVGDVYVVFRPEQIKSTSNKEFGLTNPDIHHQDKIKPESRLLQQFRQQIIDMGHPQYGQDGAEAIAQLFEARIKAFAKYSGINPDEYIKAKNFQITYDDDSSGLNSDKRGRTEFIPERRDAQGNIISEAQTIIKIFKDADRSTILHELGHVFLKDLRDAFSAGNLKGVAKQDWGTLTKWLGVGDIDFNRGLSEQDRQRWTNAHEKFATGFEKYLMSGQAPTTKLKHAFEAFKRWLTNIYHSVRNITYTGTDGQQHSFTLSNEVKQIMDRMLDENANSDNQDNNNQEQLNFDRNNRTEGYNQIIGEQGAYRLDEQEGVTTRMDNLDVAKNMLDAGKDAKTIWLATGWEKGTEGKWRYEIPYGNFTDNFNKRKNIAMSLFDENLHIQGMNDSQRLRATRFIQLRKIFNAPELFKAYPNLEKLSVTLSQLPNNEKGNYKHSLNLITLDVVSENISPDSLRTTMIHERQHAIQYIEGFVTGDNPNKHTNEVDDYQTKREALFDNMQQILDDAEITTPEIFDSLKKHYNGDISELSQEEFNKKFEQTAKSLLDEKLGSEKAAEYEKLSHDYLNLIHNWKEKYKGAATPYDIYHNNSGETEGRNAGFRSNMTDEQRRNTPLSETEDVKRDKQITVQQDKNGVETYNQHRNLPFNPDDLTTESGRSIDEAATSEMIIAPDGSKTLGRIVEPVAEFPAGDIYANAGAVRHAENSYGEQIRSMGYNDAKELLLDVLNNYSEIRRGNGKSLLLSTKSDNSHSAMGVVELVDDNGIYRVKTLHIARDRYLKNKELLFTKSEPHAASPDSDLTSSSGHIQGQEKSEFYARQQSNSKQSVNDNTSTVNNEESYNQNSSKLNPDDNSSEFYSQRLHPRARLKSWLKNMLRDIPKININSTDTHLEHDKIPQSGNPYSFLNPETEKRYKESEKGVQKTGIVSKIRQAARKLAHSFSGDFPELANNEALLYAREQFRILQRAKSRQIQDAMKTFTDNLKALTPLQLDIFARKRLLDDLNWRSKNTPDAELPFGFDRESLKRELQRFTAIANRNKQVLQAIQAEEKTMQAISQEFIKLAEQLGLKLDKVFRNPHYYRHTILEYANAAMTHGSRSRRTGNTSTLQGLIDEKLNGILNRSYMKRYKGSDKDINANYIQANGEVRAQMLMDIEIMKTLLDIKKKYDIAPRLRDKLKQIFNQTNSSNNESYSQDNEQDSLSDIIPEGYTIWNPAGSRLIQSANSTAENVIAMALDDAAESSGIPIDKLLNFLGDSGDEAFNQLCVIPNEIAETLRKLARKRDRGTLGSIARALTQWWKKAVLFTPTRNLKYNFRNFTGDLDALIAGNPSALKFAGRAFKELVKHYRGKGTSQDLQDYMDRSGGLYIESMGFSDKEIQDLQHAADDLSSSENISMPKKAWNLIKKFFAKEKTFTEAREHWLRYAAYLAYLQDMNDNNGTPSTWGASVKDEVMSLDDIHDRAFKMSNELLGAYDQVSDAGKQLREMLIPFYSWMEVNMKRYYRLFKNGLSGQNNSDFVKRLLIGKSARIPLYALSAADTFAKVSLLTMAVQMINRFLFPDDDDELPPDVKYRPHLTLGKVDGKVYYFDRIGALADAADWFALDSIFLDAKELADGQQSIAGYMKKIITAPASKIINGLNPIIKMPFEISTGRSLYPDINNPRAIRDTNKYLAQSFGLTYPYKLATGEPHSTLDEFTNMLLNSSDPDEAAYFYALDKVRQFQSRVLKKHFDGFATSQRGRVLQRLRTALRYNDRKTVQQCLREYARLDGTKQGLKQSMKAMDPLHGLTKDEQKKFLRWLSHDDRKYLKKADRYFHSLADRFIK